MSSLRVEVVSVVEDLGTVRAVGRQGVGVRIGMREQTNEKAEDGGASNGFGVDEAVSGRLSVGMRTEKRLSRRSFDQYFKAGVYLLPSTHDQHPTVRPIPR